MAALCEACGNLIKLTAVLRIAVLSDKFAQLFFILEKVIADQGPLWLAKAFTSVPNPLTALDIAEVAVINADEVCAALKPPILCSTPAIALPKFALAVTSGLDAWTALAVAKLNLAALSLNVEAAERSAAGVRATCNIPALPFTSATAVGNPALAAIEALKPLVAWPTLSAALTARLIAISVLAVA
ncbi:MAG: hypothetical protein PHQ96_06260, partial [Candidatus Omnitrophica bacterium]|nr:hypothetical protein [Candidatus Omnitrophota bacterium]